MTVGLRGRALSPDVLGRYGRRTIDSSRRLALVNRLLFVGPGESVPLADVHGAGLARHEASGRNGHPAVDLVVGRL